MPVLLKLTDWSLQLSNSDHTKGDCETRDATQTCDGPGYAKDLYKENPLEALQTIVNKLRRRQGNRGKVSVLCLINSM